VALSALKTGKEGHCGRSTRENKGGIPKVLYRKGSQLNEDRMQILSS
jgi:hypothetical protein